MLEYLLVPVLTVYSLVMSALLVYVMNFMYLSLQGWKQRTRLTRSTPALVLSEWPKVTIQLPIYNEWYVAARLIESTIKLDYPGHLIEIQVLDDSNDETVELVSQLVQKLQRRGINISHHHRKDRQGFKAGALAEGFRTANGGFIAIFDADFIPPRDFLQRMLPHFETDRVAFVQARWGHINRKYSLLTVIQSIALDAHFAIDQLARSSAGMIFNFNGTAGIWRKSAIEDAGGWHSTTFAEDLDLSYRVFLKGWQARYAGEVEVPAELPVSFTAFRRQQFRWARGGLECAILHLPRILGSKISISQKIQACLHLTGYGLHFLTLALVLLYPLLVVLASEYPSLLAPLGLGLYFNLLFFAPTLYYSSAQAILQRRWFAQLPIIILSTLLVSAMVINTAYAALQIILHKKVPIDRTPKYGIIDRHQAWDHSRYSIKIDSLILVEMALAVFNIWTAWISGQSSHWFIMIYASLFGLGLILATSLTLFQAFRHRVPT